MNCLRKSRAVLSRLLPRKPTVISAPRPLPAQARFYSASRVPRGYATPRQAPSHRHSLSLTASPPSKWFPLWQKLEPVLIVGGGVLAVYLSIVETVPFTNRPRFMVMSRKFERELGEDMFAREKRLVWPNILPPDHPDSVRVRRIASEIVRAVDRGLDDHRRRETGARAIMFRMERLLRQPQTSSLLDGWEVIVVKDDKIVNAECVPGGKIIVYTGIFENFKEDAEIATVVGHEFAHAIARHGAEYVTKAMCPFILQFLYRPGVEQALSMPFFQRMKEVEADHIGLLLLAAAGYDPRVAPGLYLKLGKLNGDDFSLLLPREGYHPPCKERARFLSQPDVMNKALDLYRGVHAAQGTTEY